MIALEAVAFRYDGGYEGLFSDFTLHMPPERIHAVMGFSGAGKSTLLKLLAGLLTPCAGTVRVPAPRIGYVAQDGRLLPWLTVAANLELGARLVTEPDALAAWRRELTDAFGLAGALGLRPHALSGGMRQRAAVISALTSGADTLLLDEPFAGSDRNRKAVMFEALSRFMRDAPSRTIVLCTHEPSDVFSLGAACVWIDSVTRRPETIAPRGSWDDAARRQLLGRIAGEPVR